MIEQLSKLLTRQQHLYNKEREEEMKALTYMYKYKTKYVGEKALYDIEAKKKLSTYAHSKLYQVSMKKSANLSHKLSVDGKSYIVWPTGNHPDALISIIIPVGLKCKCLFRTMYACQCEHEFAIDPQFMLDQ